MKVESWMVRAPSEPMELATREETPATGEVLVKVAGCGVCHTDLGFFYDGVPTRHPFPLTLGHAGRRCSDCHQSGTYQGTPTDCQACHLDDFNGTTNPNHRNQGFGTDCQVCHRGVDTWRGAVFNHSFPRTGTRLAYFSSRCSLAA